MSEVMSSSCAPAPRASIITTCSRVLSACVRGSAGYITGWNGDDTRILDRFFKGGDSFRGFERSGIGPRDVGVANEDALGGEVFRDRHC